MEQIVLDLDGHKEIYFLGDLHYPRGKIECFRRVLNQIEEDIDARMIGMGDWIEGIAHSDPRYHPEETASIIKQSNIALNMLDEQWYGVEELLKPVADKILGLHYGNHGGNVVKRHSHNELRQICRRHSIPFLQDGVAYFELRCQKNKIKLLTMHGIGGGLSAGYPYNKLDQYGTYFEGIDVVAAGHTHKLGVNIACAPLKLCKNKIKAQSQYQCSTGSFLGNYEEGVVTYGERMGYKPLPLGYIKMIIDGGMISKIYAVPME